MKRATKKRKNIWIWVGVGMIFPLLCISFVGIRLYTAAQVNYPPEPVASGDFPSQPKWVFSADKKILSSPTVYGSHIFVRTIDGLYALNVSDGSVAWHVETSMTEDGSLNWAPLIAGNQVIIPEKRSTLASYSIDNGKRLWHTFPLTDFLGYESGRIGSYVLWDNILYVAHQNVSLIAYDISNGDIIWNVSVPGRTDLVLAVDQRALYLEAYPSIKAYDLKRGEVLWEKEINKVMSSILVDGNLLYVSLLAEEDAVIAIDLDTQEEVWSIRSNDIQSDELRHMVVQGDVLYLAAKRLVAVSKNNGRINWISEITGLIEPPIIHGNDIFVRNTRTILYELDATNGKEKGRLKVQLDTYEINDPFRTPTLADGLLIVPFGDNRIFAYQL